MIRYRSRKQRPLADFECPFRLRLMRITAGFGAVIIKHKLCLSDEQTVQWIQANPCLRYSAGLPGYQMEAPFAPSLFAEIRKRMG